MNAIAAAQEIADLRHRRRELRRELARVRWWRRLVGSRRDLALASLARPDAVAGDVLDAAWAALASDAPTSAELAGAVWPEGAMVRPGDLDQLDALDTRLDRYEALLSDTLDTVTAQMVSAMGRTREGDDG